MIYSSQIPHMNLIIIFMLITLQCTHNLVVEAALNAAEYLNVHALQELHFMEDNGDLKDNHVEKVSGEDENEKKEALILEKFRALLGLKSFKTSPSPSPSPSPLPSPLPTIEAEAPAPAPMVPIHAHSHHPFHHSHHIPPHHKIHKEDTDQGRVRRIIISVLVSAGAIFIMCAIGLLWICRKFSEESKKSKGTVSIYSTEEVHTSRSKFVSPQNSSKKVSSDSDLDLFHLDSVLEPKALHTSPNQKTSNSILHERGEFDKEPIKSESDNASYSVAGEILSVHESVESIGCESDKSLSSSGDNIVYFEAHSSDDDESFHSFNDSYSSNVRLSNASLASPSDKPKTLSPNVSKVSYSVTSPMNLAIPSPIPRNSEQNMQAAPSSSNCQIGFTPPPPPPPPPPPCVHVSPYRASCSMRITSKPLSSSTLPKLSSPRNSDSSSGSNITPKRDLPLSLPNPPKSQVGIPPPPCPPPFSKGNGKHLKGPPPPPPQLPQYVPLGKDGAPLPKLKPLHWDKVRAASNRSTVWDKLKSSSFEFDEEMIESLFGYNLQDSMKNDGGKSKSPSPSKHVLDPKRLQNITILSKALNATAEQVCDALIKGNGLCLQQLEVLVKMVPTKEEEALLFGYKGNINELGSAERFVKAMLNIPFAFLRIEAMLYRETFEDEVIHLRKSFSMLEEACKELRSSRLFLKLLEAVLKTGNRMNVGTIRGGARAFKLDALLKLADVKGTDGKTTLLHFVVQEIVRSEGIRTSESIMGKINQKSKSKNVEEREEHYRRMGLDLVSGLSTELCNVKKTATIDLDVLAISVSNLSDGMAKLKHLVNKNLCVDEKSGGFVHSMRSFLGYAEKNIKELKEDEDNVLLLVRKITEYFHGDVSKDEANPLRIFVIVRDFLGMLDHVCKELRSLKVPSSPSPLAPFR